MDDKMGELGGESKMGFARMLASPKKKTREKAVSLLVLWLTSQKQLEENELKKIWKGLFYCVWHSDKATVQADLIERLASIFEKLDITLALQFFKVFLITMRREWAGIDRLRLDKFYLLLRKCLAYMLLALQKSGWRSDCTKEFMDIFEENAFLAKDRYAALGVNLHYADIFLQELKNFLPMDVETFKLLLEPFLVVCAHTLDKSLLERVKENIFEHLFNLGRSVITAKQDGNPSDSVEEVLTSLFLSLPLGTEAFKLASLPSTSQASRKALYDLHREFEKLEKLFNTSGITFSLVTDILKKGKKKKNKSLGPVRIIEKPTKKKERHEKTVKSSKMTSKSGLDEGMLATITLDRRKRSGTGSLKGRDDSKEGIAFSESEKGEGRSENSESIFPAKEDQVATVDEGKKKKKGSSGKRKKVDVVEASDERPQIVSNGLGADDSVVSKLEKQFDLLADESLSKSDISLLPSKKVPDTGNRKRKQRISTDGVVKGHKAIKLAVSSAEKDTTPSTAIKSGNSSGKVKKVRFALKKNLVWTPSTPLPAESVRVPPSATPRGSALKKGVPPGPIVVETAITLKNRRGTPMRRSTNVKAYKNKKNVMKHVKLLLEKELGDGIKRGFGERGKLFLGGLLE